MGGGASGRRLECEESSLRKQEVDWEEGDWEKHEGDSGGSKK